VCSLLIKDAVIENFEMLVKSVETIPFVSEYYVESMHLLLLQPNIDVIQGTVPYLGTFLTDLTMIDTALKVSTKDGLINFDKCRKEFELMTQIRMLQLSANQYSIEAEPDFFTWFYNLRIYDDIER